MLVRWVRLHAEPYCEKDTNLSGTGLSKVLVVLGMIEKCDLTKGSTVAMGNFFITLPLLDKLTDIDMYGVGIIWENRLQGAPLKKKAAFQKETRANIWLHIWCKQFSCCLERQQRCHRCHQLFVAKSSFVNKALVERWEKTYRRTNANFKDYNANMGGFDSFYQFVSTYLVQIRSKKCWWPFFAWSINATEITAWKLFRKIHGNDIPLLKFYLKLCLKSWETMAETNQHNLSIPLE